jgi:benzil reductase ((S)-benzoin forming)
MANLAIITGTSRGLGKALKQEFERVGWRVAELNRPAFDLSAIDVEKLDLTLKSLRSEDFDRVVFVNNAATQAIAAAASFGAAEISREITVNVTSPIIAITRFLRSFPNGEIANVTSAAATKAVPHWSLYCAAKAALDGYIRAVEAEGWRVFNLNPGVIDTDMQAQIRDTEFPGVQDFIVLKRDGKLRSSDAVARNLVWMMDRAE